MTAFLPPNLLALFAPRDPIPFFPPVDKLPFEKKNTHNYAGRLNLTLLYLSSSKKSWYLVGT